MCQPSSRPGCGSSTPATTARPTPWTPTPSPSSRSAPKGCGWWSRTVSSRPCGCSPTAATSSPANGSRRSTGCSACSANCCLASANATCPPLRPRPCSPRVRPRDIAGKTRRRMAAEEIADLVAVDAKLKKIKAELKAAVLERGSTLMDIYGVGPAGAARVLADVGDVARFADRNRFASWTGTAPLDASSGRADPPPPVTGREPADEPRPARRRDRADPPRHRGPRLLPTQARRRQDTDGGTAVPEATPVRRRLPPARRRRPAHTTAG